MKYLSLLLLPLLLLTACGGREEAKIETRTRAIRYGVVTTDDGNTTQTYTGVATAAGETPLSFRVSGTIRTLPVKLGEQVKKGQLIATIDPADLQVQSSQSRAQYEASQAQVQSAETQLVAARAAYERTTRLYESNSVSLSDFEQARSQFQNAQAQVEAAKSQLNASGAQVRAAQNQVSYTRLTAPFDGVITTLNAEANEFAGSGKVIVTLSTETDPEVQVNLPESRIGAVYTGMKVDIDFSALPGQQHRGEVVEVAYASGDAPSYPVKIRIFDAPATIRPGMAASVQFTFADSRAAGNLLLTPIESVTEGPTDKFVYLLTPSDSGNTYVAYKKTITIGELHQRGFEVKTGLKAGDKVATAGLKQLLDGMEVRLLE
ncbi:RND family efflux transporter MFP subunit [Lewinella marina]|uniref:Efflux transporter periplasmic adaptor subunit n=1 Tax=Neolewinella marina TaxID=438751 RepID=A0A2G0CDU2_9BACT|nr:efflux RND transporter periplasmic adaptor subunit [Neolewinella marina]NJB85934.1 RND family efflux transporter MFP subunit [Neolewinella marina]PHK98090.1 hypothetical protein CGL56_12945 [Neolewinella marina]